MIKTGDMTGDEIASAREMLGQRWGLGRGLTALEMARALGLSPTNGDDHVKNMEKQKSKVSGSIAVLVTLYLNGAVPPAECEVIRSGMSDYAVKKEVVEQAEVEAQAEAAAEKKRARKKEPA